MEASSGPAGSDSNSARRWRGRVLFPFSLGCRGGSGKTVAFAPVGAAKGERDAFMTTRGRATWRNLASLRWTVWLLACAMVLTFAGTLAQTRHGIAWVLDRYFRSLLAWIDLAAFFPENVSVPHLVLPFPGGYSIGALLTLNLCAAFFVRFQPVRKSRRRHLLGSLLLLLGGFFAIAAMMGWGTEFPGEGHADAFWRVAFRLARGSVAALTLFLGFALLYGRRGGLALLHAGILFLMAGEFFAGWRSETGRITLRPGERAEFVELSGKFELAFVETTPSGRERTTVVPEELLRPGEIVPLPDLPFDLRVNEFFFNATRPRPRETGGEEYAGVGAFRCVSEKPDVGKGRRVPAVDFDLVARAEGRSLGRRLASPWFYPPFFGKRGPAPESLETAGRRFRIALRPKRRFLETSSGNPFSLRLESFRHETYEGTRIPKDFSSRIRLVCEPEGVDRRVRIRMNNPLRYARRTFYQSGYLPGDAGTILQVVRNDAWMVPYLACMMGAIGLIAHFAGRAFSGPAPKGGGAPEEPVRRGRPSAATLLAATAFSAWILLLGIFPPKNEGGFDLSGFARLPMKYDGRVKPLDTYARNLLSVLSGKQSLRREGRRVCAREWMLEALSNPEAADAMPVFRIDDPELSSDLGLEKRKGFRYAYRELRPVLNRLDSSARIAAGKEAGERDRYDRAALRLSDAAWLYRSARAAFCDPLRAEDAAGLPLAVPPSPESSRWRAVATTGREDPVAEGWRDLLDARALDDANRFQTALRSLEKEMIRRLPEMTKRASFETFCNRFDAFLKAAELYFLAFLASCAAWLTRRRGWRDAAPILLAFAFIPHTFGLVARCFLSGYPPVTNLYSSAIFVGWAAIPVGLTLDRRRPQAGGAGTMAAALIGFCTLLVARFLSGDGDTLERMRAVLDSRFWLTTHVVTISLGYMASFLAGTLGILSVFSPRDDVRRREELGRMVLSTIRFALLFGFLGTVLGGLWADDSWGRFWGWDPKENGALLTVLWNAVILHLAADRHCGARGLALLAIGGNVVVAWSWFGVNQLNVGLHSYGFTSSATWGLILFVLSQLAVVSWGLIRWRRAGAR